MADAVVVNVHDPESGVRRSSIKGKQSTSDIGVAPKSNKGEDRQKSRDLYCFVLGADKYGSFKTKEAAEEFRQTMVNDLVAAGLDCTLFYSIQGDEIFIRVGTNDQRLLQEADHIEYSLELDADAIKKIAETDRMKEDGRKALHLEPPFPEEQRFEALGLLGNWSRMSDADIMRYLRRETRLSPFQYLHARYNDEWEKYGDKVFGVGIYKRYADGTILRTADRMKLIQIIMERSRQPDLATGAKGAGLNLSALVLKKKILGVFPLQNTINLLETSEPTVDELFAKWNRMAKLPWNQPLDDIRDYFGEKIALYFAFLGHYTMWLSVAAIIGLALFIHQLANIQRFTGKANFFDVTDLVNVTGSSEAEVVVYSEVPEAPFFSLFIAFWATFMLEFWKRKQSWLAMRWGTSNFEQSEVIRPEFVPTHYLPSPITGHSEPYYSYSTFLAKLTSSIVIIFCCIGVVVATIAGIFVFKVFVSLDPEQTGLTQETGTYLALVINAVVIIILGNVYKVIAKILNDWENHRTDTQYEDALIAKTFVFSFVNSYATLFYLAFIKSGTTILGQVQLCEPKSEGPNKTQIARDACFGNLGTSLLIVFLLQLVINNTMELGIPTVMGFFKKRSNTKMPKKKKDAVEAETPLNDDIMIRSPCEDQFYKKSYEGTFDDFLEIALQFGYVTLFVAAFPLAPFLAFVNNQVEIRVDSYKLCKLCRRPVNFGAQDIGTWEKIFYIMGLIAVMTNAGVIFFTSRIVDIHTTAGVDANSLRVWAWVISVMGVLLCKIAADYLLSDVPSEVRIQLAREDYIVRKCLLRERDDEEEDEEGNVASTSKEVNFKITKTDPNIRNVIAGMADEIRKGYANFEEAFKAADRNKDGQVSKKELKRMLRLMDGVYSKLPESEIDAIMDCLDYNNNGKIEYEEFVRLSKQ